MTPEVRLELERLLSALCDGVLNDAQHARLEQLLDMEADCRRYYLEYMDLHARLLTHPSLGEAELPAAAELAHRESSGAGPIRNGDLPVIAAEKVETPVAKRARIPQLARYALVAGTTLAVSFLLQVFWLHPDDRGPPHGPAAIDPPQASAPVATLIALADDAWDDRPDPPQVGARFAAGPLRLKKGLARIRFDTGSEVVLEGPAEFCLDSATAATLRSGKAVLSRDAMAAPFDLHTPMATVMDLGTEYGVAVGPDDEQIQVFAGEVQRVPGGKAGAGAPEYVKAGEARHWPNLPVLGKPLGSEPLGFDPARFVRKLAAPGQPPADPVAGLLAYEGFDYPSPELFATGKANGGFGWTNPWTVTVAQPLEWGPDKRLPLNVEESLFRPTTPMASIGGRFDHAGFGIYYRRLETPVCLDRDGVYFVSYLFRRNGPPGHAFNIVALMFRPDGEPDNQPDLGKRLMLGVGGSNQVFTRLGMDCARAAMPIGSGTTYLLVAKIVTSRTGFDQVFVRVYGQREPVSSEEPASWTIVGPPFHSDLVFASLGIHVNSKHRQMVDEIRVGTTWSSVAGPWMAAPAVPKNKP